MSHLSYEQRYTIEVLLKDGQPQKEIARVLSLNKSVICREIKRNCDGRSRVYKAKLAQSKYEHRQRSKPKHLKFTDKIRSEVIGMIEQDYSPEQVAGLLKKNGGTTISHEWIYQFIWRDKKQQGTLHTHLRHKGRRYRKSGSNILIEFKGKQYYVEVVRDKCIQFDPQKIQFFYDKERDEVYEESGLAVRQVVACFILYLCSCIWLFTVIRKRLSSS